MGSKGERRKVRAAIPHSPIRYIVVVIILSLVRSNDSHEVGFLSDRRRINVAVTRAKRQLVVVGDYETCSSDPFLKELLDYISENGDHRSAAEFIESKSYSPIDIETPKTATTALAPANQSKEIAVESSSRKKVPKHASRKVSSSAYITLSEYEAKVQESLCSLVKQFSEKSVSGGPVKVIAYNTTINHNAELVHLEKTEENQSNLEFPSTLNAFQRMKLHALAEERKLHHRTVECLDGKTLLISHEIVSNAADINNIPGENSLDALRDAARVKWESSRNPLKSDVNHQKSTTKRNSHDSSNITKLGSHYVSPYRPAHMQEAIDFSMEDEDALLDAAINANKVGYHHTKPISILIMILGFHREIEIPNIGSTDAKS